MHKHQLRLIRQETFYGIDELEPQTVFNQKSRHTLKSHASRTDAEQH